MAVKFLDKTGLGYFWGKIKAWCNSTFAAIAHTHTSYAVKHSYTTAANAAKNWYRIANANTHQMDTSKPLHVQFLLSAWNPDQPADYYEQWFIDCQVFGRNSGIRIFGASGAPFSQARVLYENTVADIDTNDRPAIDIYLNYALATACHVEIQEVYNSGWTFLANGVLAASTIPIGFENRAVSSQGSGVHQATYASYGTYTTLQRSNITANITLADNDTYRMRVLNCTNAITVTVPSLNSVYAWFLIKNFNAVSTNKNVTIHPSTTSVLIDDSNADIVLKPGEWVIIASKAANSYSLIGDGRWKSKKADKATTLAGYGITDAKIANGTITLGSNSITPLTSVPSHNQASDTINLLTGYSRPNTGGALATTDTLNQALGKLEAKTEEALINSSGVPVGTVVWLSTSTVPVGYLLCNGQAVGRDTYPNLFNAIGTTYGAGDGSTTFNLPNLIDRFAEGSTVVGTVKAAGLPNITGYVNSVCTFGTYATWQNGCFQSINDRNVNSLSTGTVANDSLRTFDFNASRSSAIYGNSNTVQPPALTLLPCIKAYNSVENISSLDAAQLENEIQNNFVHLTGDEVITGRKIFTWNQFLMDDTATYDSSTGGAYSLVFKDKNNVEVGRIQSLFSSSDNCTLLRVYLRDRSRDYQVGLRDSGAIYFGPRGIGSSGIINLGQAGNYWKEVFAYSSAINTSDARLKKNIVNISDVVLDAWENIDWKQFKMVDAIESKGEDRARWHTGLVAQDLDKIFSDLGLEARDYGFFCYDEWQAEPRIEKDGEVLNEGREAGNQYALRYIEALSIEAAYQRRKNKILEDRISELEKRLVKLEGIIQ